MEEDFSKCPECKRRQLERLQQMADAAALRELVNRR